jgi:chromosome segregation ATPase
MSDEPTTLIEELDIALAVGGLSPAQEAIIRTASHRIAELEAEKESYLSQLAHANLSIKQLESGMNELADKWREQRPAIEKCEDVPGLLADDLDELRSKRNVGQEILDSINELKNNDHRS